MAAAPASPDHRSSQARVNRHAHRLAASLPWRYGVILLAVGTLLVIDQAVLQPRLTRLSVYAPQINVAGRQRMLSQKLVKAALALQASQDSDSRHTELHHTLALWRTSHYGLLDGSEDLGLPRTLSPEIREAFATLNPHFLAMGQAAETLIDGEISQQQIDVLLAHESQFLPTMDRIVGLYEQEARSQATMLRYLGLAASLSVIGLMIALGHFVLRPATRTIHGQMESLEDRVAERTAELTSLNRMLQREIINRQQAQERTRELSGQLAHTTRVMSMGQLATGLAHEINQPLAAITNYADTCNELLNQETQDRQALSHIVDRIRRSAERAGDIVRGMRNFLQPGQTPVGCIAIRALVEEVIALCHPELERNNVALEVELTDDVVVEVAQIQVQQVLVNLVQNAIQAMQPCSEEQRRLQIVASRLSDGVQFEVSDSGPGFGERDPEEVFEPFYTTKTSGLGMGLAIARSIIEEHAGRLWAENRTTGASVCFTLPLEQKHAGQVATNDYCVCR